MFEPALVGLEPWSCCFSICSAKIPAQSEDEPIGWFELESEWNDTEIQLQQCRVAKVNPAFTDVTLKQRSSFSFNYLFVLKNDQFCLPLSENIVFIDAIL